MRDNGNPSNIKADGCVVLSKEVRKSALGIEKSKIVAIKVGIAESKVNPATIGICMCGNSTPKLKPVNSAI